MTVTMQHRRLFWMTSMAPTSAADVRLHMVQGPYASLTISDTRIARGSFLWGKLRDCSLFLFAKDSVLQSSCQKMERELPCTNSRSGYLKKVGCTQIFSLVCRSWTLLLPTTGVTQETNRQAIMCFMKLNQYEIK